MARVKKLDFTGVESYTKASEGIHTAKVAEILEKTSQGGDDMLQFKFEITKGEDKGSAVFESFVLTDKALWKFKAFLQAIGMKADGKLKIDLDKLIGKVCDIEVFWEEYNGQTRAKISDYYKAGKGGKVEDEDLDDEDEDDTDDEEEEEEEAPKKKAPAKKTPAKKAPAKKKPEPEDDDEVEEEDEDDEDEDEDEEPAPKRKSKKAPPAKKKAPAKKSKKSSDDEDDEDDDEDDDWEEDD